MNATGEVGPVGQHAVDRAIAHLRQAIVVSALRRKHGLEGVGKLKDLDIAVGESLDDYAVRLLAKGRHSHEKMWHTRVTTKTKRWDE